MNTQPEPYDKQPIQQPDLDESLLDEALQPEPTPADLRDKILALTDPEMLTLLDEALRPDSATDTTQLNQRILAATQHAMRPGSVVLAPASAAQSADGVLARIGHWSFRYAAAAAIAMALGLGLWFNHQTNQPTDPVAQIGDTPATVEDPSYPDWLSQEAYASTQGLFESATSPLEQTLGDVADRLEEIAISRDTLWAELDAYEQFLNDFES